MPGKVGRPKKQRPEDTPTEEIVATSQATDYMRWIKVGGAWRGEGDTYPDGLPRWVPESTIINPKSDSMMTGDDLIQRIYKGGWKFGPLLQHSGYGLLIVYRDEVPEKVE
jgi:hypothetical protein